LGKFRGIGLIAVLASLLGAGCSAFESDIAPRADLVATTPIGEPGAPASTPNKEASSNCLTVSRWWEGFLGREKTHARSIGALEKALEEEKARLTRRGWQSFEVSPVNTACQTTYPLGFQEWRCSSKAELCPIGNKKSAMDG